MHCLATNHLNANIFHPDENIRKQSPAVPAIGHKYKMVNQSLALSPNDDLFCFVASTFIIY